MPLQKLTSQYINQHNLCTVNHTVLLAISGGVDSMVLLHILQTLGYSVAVAHCNYQLRGNASDADEALVTQYCKENNITIFTKKMDTATYMAEHKIGLQEAARTLRYSWFATIINPTTNLPYQYIATAHHANDNVETVLMNICKGTGIAGLRGILPKQTNIIRPLLYATKAQIEAYSTTHNIQYLTDASNATNKYSRNYMRNQVLPLLAQQYPQIVNNIVQNIDRCTDIEHLYTEIVNNKIKKITEQKGNELHIPLLKLTKEKAYKTLLYEIVKPYNFTTNQLAEIIKLFKANNSSYITSTTHQIIKNRNWLIITTLTTTEANNIIIEANTNIINFALGKIEILTTHNLTVINDANTACIDAALLTFPLLLRPFRKGDYFYPLGLPKKKKIARFMIDNKLSKTQKENTWVLENNGLVIWVVGHRIDDRYKVTANTNAIYLLKLSKF